MSRASLMRAAKRAKVSTTGPKNGLYVITIDELRVRILEHCLGPNLGVIKGTSPEIDAAIDRSVMCLAGELGRDLCWSQWFIRKSNNERGEALKLAAAKKPDWDVIDKLLSSSKQYLSMACISQNLHSIERGMRDNVASEYREPMMDTPHSRHGDFAE
jgi:hypothetical protein